MDCLVGDAFQADEQKSNKQHGVRVQRDNMEIVFGSSSESASIDPKCNTVTLIKYDKRLYRNTIAVGESFICYTVKGNLLRIIDSASSNMVLLRGHESTVQDICFSSADSDVLCSVDAGEGDCRHVFVWRLTSSDSDVEQSLEFTLPLRANNVKSHPVTSSCWGISFGNEVGLFHTDVDAGAQSYKDLTCQLSFKDPVIDFCFSPNGKHVAVINGTGAQTSIGVFNLTGGDSADQLRAGQCSLAPKYMVVAEPGQLFSGLALLAPPSREAGTGPGTDCVLVTLSVSSSSSSSGDAGASVGSWIVQVWTLAGGKQSMTQSLALVLPKSFQAEATGYPQSTLTLDTHEGRFLLVSSRCSTIVACLGITTSDDSSCQRLHHCTFLNLKNPVSSVVSSTVRIREKDETGRAPEPHVEITCFQDQQNGQNAVQQYHVPSKWVFQPPCPTESPKQGDEEEVEEAPIVLSPIAFGAEKVDSSTFLKHVLFSKSPSNVPASASAPVLSLAVPLTPPATATATATAAAVSPAYSGISILSNHNGSTASLPVGSFPDFALISDKNTTVTADKPAALSSTTTAPIASSPSTPGPPKQDDIGVKSKQILLSALKVHSSPSPPVVASIQQPPGAAAKAKPVAPPIVVPTASVPPAVSRKQQSAEEDDEDDWERASISISRSQPTTPQASSEHKSSSSSDSYKFDELLALTLRMEEKIVSLEEKTLTAEKRRKKTAATEASAMSNALTTMKDELAREVVAGVQQVQLRALSGLVEQKAQQAVANILTSDKWKQQLSSAVSADLCKELSPAISQTIRSSVKKNLGEVMMDSFRNTLEATIVPAYEAASREMFSQLQQTHAAGVQAMQMDNKDQCDRSIAETVALRHEVELLRNVVSGLEEKISRLSQGAIVAGGSSSDSDNRYETDFKQLMREGRIGESLEMALETKNVENTLWVLKQQAAIHGGLSALFDKATEISILCTVQQLSADLALNEPEEGIRSRLECLKEMVMFLIDDHMPVGNVSELVTSTLSYLRNAEAKHTLVGAARTDMKMLCSILSSNF